MNRILPPCFIAIAALAFVRAALALDTAEYEKTVKPFFQDHCLKCHDERKQKGDLRLDTLEADFAGVKTSGHWTDILDQLNSGDMPPKKESRPKARETAAVVGWIASQLAEAETGRQASAERVSFHKLTRDEYVNSIRDLLGVIYDAHDTTGMQEDPDWLGFERIGSVLTFAPAHIERYLAAAEAVLDEALALQPQPKQKVVHWGPYEMRTKWGALRKFYAELGTTDKLRLSIVPNNNADGNPGSSTKLEIPASGEYLVRVKLSGLRPAGGRAPRINIQETTIDRSLLCHDVDTPEDQPVVLESRVHLPAGHRLIRITNDVPGPEPTGRYSRDHSTIAFTGTNTRIPWQLKLTDDNYKPIAPFLLVDYVEFEGPIVASWPTPADQQIFGEGNKDSAQLRDIVTRFAPRAFRRPAHPDEIDRYTQLGEEEMKSGKTFDMSVRTALLAMLCSKDFLYLVEGSSVTATAKLTDYELASRLSYFLWSTAPDEALLSLAKNGQLHEPAALHAQVRRMLHDPRAAAFAEAFPHDWLQLRRVGMFAPDKTLYPDYDGYLQESMIRETTSYFAEVLTHNLSLREFLDSDWTMLNERLAMLYGIGGVRGEGFRRVTLKPEDHRGGLLTQAALLSLTSDGMRQRPVHRGKWLSESILGKPVPPPPANVPAIKTPQADQPKTTLREKLVAHREDATCAACHQKIDPLGLAFENYDAIGRWRTEEIVADGSGTDPRVDPSGELPDGRTFTDANDFKHLLLDDSDKFATAFTEKLATFAMRRVMTYSDRTDLQRITAQSKADGYRLADLIETFVTSDLFQKR